MFETVKRWNRRYVKWANEVNERDWQAHKANLGERGRRYFEATVAFYLVVAMTMGIVVGVFVGLQYQTLRCANGVCSTSLEYIDILTSISFWIIVGGLAFMTVSLELMQHPIRDFYRKRKELFGRRFT